MSSERPIPEFLNTVPLQKSRYIPILVSEMYIGIPCQFLLPMCLRERAAELTVIATEVKVIRTSTSRIYYNPCDECQCYLPPILL